MLIPRGAGRDSTRFFERRRKKVVGEGGMAWNFKHGAHNGLGHVLVYLVMIPTNEVQLLGNSTMLLRGMLPQSGKKLRDCRFQKINYRDRWLDGEWTLVGNLETRSKMRSKCLEVGTIDTVFDIRKLDRFHEYLTSYTRHILYISLFSQLFIPFIYSFITPYFNSFFSFFFQQLKNICSFGKHDRGTEL